MMSLSRVPSPWRRHCPKFSNTTTGTDLDWRCVLCGGDPVDPIHWPPRGLRERVLDALGMLR